jgi:ribonucleoside-diphosphate reductase beta chain
MVIESSKIFMEELDLTKHDSDFNKNEELVLPMRLDEVNEYLCSKEPIYNDSRMQLYPIKYDDIWDMYNKAKAAFWVAEEVSLTDDVTDWEKLDEEEKHFILMVLAFFACSDFIVNENLDEGYTDMVKVPELKMFLHYQEMMEDIHSQMYQILINTLVKDNVLKDKLFHATVRIPSIQKKAEWARKQIKTQNLIGRLVAFACVEGIFFSGSFCSLFWLKKRGLMKGLCHSNELIARDEGMHRDMACLIYNKYIVNKFNPDNVKKIVKEAVEIEKEFVCESLPYNLKGMNKELMCQYIEYVADHMCMSMIEDKIYNVENPFPWMDLISLEGKTNFFEKRVSSYAKQSVITHESQKEISFDEDF